MASQFLTVFGRPARVICDASERSSDPSIGQALHIINGDTLNKKLSNPEGYISLLLRLGLSDSRIVEHMTLSAFSRYPTDAEREELGKLWRTPDCKRHGRAAEGCAPAGARRHGLGNAD